jgi:hypothetical protein
MAVFILTYRSYASFGDKAIRVAERLGVSPLFDASCRRDPYFPVDRRLPRPTVGCLCRPAISCKLNKADYLIYITRLLCRRAAGKYVVSGILRIVEKFPTHRDAWEKLKKVGYDGAHMPHNLVIPGSDANALFVHFQRLHNYKTSCGRDRQTALMRYRRRAMCAHYFECEWVWSRLVSPACGRVLSPGIWKHTRLSKRFDSWRGGPGIIGIKGQRDGVEISPNEYADFVSCLRLCPRICILNDRPSLRPRTG